MSLAHIYLLQNAEGTAFKIGVAVDVETRIKQIGAALDRDHSFYCQVPAKDAYTLERKLHTIFANFRIVLGYKSGNTEWFDIEALQTARAILEEFSENFRIGPLVGVDKPHKHVVLGDGSAESIGSYAIERELTMVRAIQHRRYLLREKAELEEFLNLPSDEPPNVREYNEWMVKNAPRVRLRDCEMGLSRSDENMEMLSQSELETYRVLEKWLEAQ